jgi:hypothetical protein
MASLRSDHHIESTPEISIKDILNNEFLYKTLFRIQKYVILDSITNHKGELIDFNVSDIPAVIDDPNYKLIKNVQSLFKSNSRVTFSYLDQDLNIYHLFVNCDYSKKNMLEYLSVGYVKKIFNIAQNVFDNMSANILPNIFSLLVKLKNMEDDEDEEDMSEILYESDDDSKQKIPNAPINFGSPVLKRYDSFTGNGTIDPYTETEIDYKKYSSKVKTKKRSKPLAVLENLKKFFKSEDGKNALINKNKLLDFMGDEKISGAYVIGNFEDRPVTLEILHLGEEKIGYNSMFFDLEDLI